MSLISVVCVLLVVFVLLGLVNKYAGEWVAAPGLKIINAVVVIAVILWLLGVFGLWDGLSNIRVGR